MSIINGNSNTPNGHRTAGLKIIIVGAGIGGLSAAIALRKNGHHIDIYESSKFATELGAAIHLPPNANGVLKRLGVDGRQIGANGCDHVSSYSSNGDLWSSIDLRVPNKLWQHEWLLGHRVRLHNALKERALDPEGYGPPAMLHLSQPVASVDPNSATVTLRDGTQVQADVMIGADGVHSVTRSHVQDIKAFSSGKSAFRFLVPRQTVLDDPQTCKYQSKDGELVMAYGSDRRMVMYPTTDNTLLNFVCIHPEAESAAVSSGDWNNDANLHLLLEVFRDFHEDFRAILRKVDASTLKVWKLLDMKPLDTWVKDRLALAGDAAHPFLPHQGQGGAVAIEDAAALAVVLEEGLSPAEVPERLQLYQEIRKERADKLQHYTRLAGEDLKPGQQAFDVRKFTAFNFGHDEFDNAAQKLREWKWARKPQSYKRMPLAFGPMPGPRQTHWGEVRNGANSTFTTASIKFKTSRTVLQNLFPPGSRNWQFKSPGTVAFASFSQTTLNEMEWLGGSGYNHLGLYIHGIEYIRKDGSAVSGTYMPVLFENLADPIVSGREELGMPKLYSAIDVSRGSASYKIELSWRNTKWAKFELEDLHESTDVSSVSGKMTGDDADEGILVQRYIPAVGRERRGTAEAEYAVFDSFADADPRPRVERVWATNKASFEFEKSDWTTLPTLHHIAERLAEIPVYEVVAAKVVSGVGVPDVSSARPIEH